MPRRGSWAAAYAPFAVLLVVPLCCCAACAACLPRAPDAPTTALCGFGDEAKGGPSLLPGVVARSDAL